MFGLVISRGLTRRLAALSAAADAWSERNFQPLPPEKGGDEIGLLGRRLRHTAERIQTLMQSQQARVAQRRFRQDPQAYLTDLESRLVKLPLPP